MMFTPISRQTGVRALEAHPAMWESLGIAVVVLIAALFFDGLRVREAAIHIAREACREHGLQFLDYTVQGARTRLARNAAGHTRLRRTYLFDFSDDGVGRRSGRVVMLGSELESLQLEPYRLSSRAQSPP